MDLAQYKQELTCAEAMGRLERPAYWQAFRRGLQRAFFGEGVVGDTEHYAWLGMLDDESAERCERATGYRDGYAIGIEAASGKED